jgi:hypothetical protein
MIVSAAVHAALLAVTLIAFSDTRKFDEAQESVPVEVLTDKQFNEIMQGEKDAKPAQAPKVRVDKQSEVEEKKPPTPKEAKADVQAPPPPLKRMPDPGEDETPEPPVPPRRVAALPPEPEKPTPPVPAPPLPTPRPPDPPKAEAPPEPPKQEAEPIEPPRRPPEPKKAEQTPTPPTPPTPPVRPRPAPPEAKPKPQEKPLDKVALAKLLEKTEDAQKPATRPRSGDETSQTRSRFDPNAIAQVLSREPPGQRPSTGQEASRTASLGAPTAHAQRMSPSLSAQIDGFIVDRYKQCWSPPPGYDNRYLPQIKLTYNADGSLQGQPVLMNPASDPKDRAMAESALRAVRHPLCNPMRFPANFMPYFDQWRGPRILRFDPAEMLG